MTAPGGDSDVGGRSALKTGVAPGLKRFAEGASGLPLLRTATKTSE